jgi:hypothetical protein
VQIISAMREGLIERALAQEDFDAGTVIRA